jgi:hypothetical protein
MRLYTCFDKNWLGYILGDFKIKTHLVTMAVSIFLPSLIVAAILESHGSRADRGDGLVRQVSGRVDGQLEHLLRVRRLNSDLLRSILQNSISAKNVSDKISAPNCGQISSQKQ